MSSDPSKAKKIVVIDTGSDSDIYNVDHGMQPAGPVIKRERQTHVRRPEKIQLNITEGARPRSRERVSHDHQAKNWRNSHPRYRPHERAIQTGSLSPETPNPIAPPPVIINNRIIIHDSSSDDIPGDSLSVHGKQQQRRRSRRSNHKQRHKDDSQLQKSRTLIGDSENRNPHDVLTERGVSGMWDPSHNSNLTIHLNLPIQEDLDAQLEEFCHFQRLGDFDSARRFFGQNLEDQQDNPYVLVQYAEMLLDQGDYNAMSEIEGAPQITSENQQLNNGEGRLLIMYWRLMQLEKARHNPGISREAFNIIPEVLKTIHIVVATDASQIGSTEIKMLALLIHMASTSAHVYMQGDWLKEQLQKLFPPIFYRNLYRNLLRQGRMWDFRDIFVAKLRAVGLKDAAQVFRDPMDARKPLQALIADWEVSKSNNESLTTLALLDILVQVSSNEYLTQRRYNNATEDSMAMAKPFALSIMENDPSGMKSRPFIMWMLTQAQIANRKRPSQSQNLTERLQSQPGIFLDLACSQLPQYIPAKDENPGWRIEDAAPEYRNPAKIVLKTAQKHGDYRTQSMALEELIRLAKDPRKEFDELCTLRKLTQGNFKAYSQLLVSKYLILATPALDIEFRDELREVCFNAGLGDFLTAEEIWAISMLLYSIEGKGPEAEKALEMALDSCKYLTEEKIEVLDKKLPELRLKRQGYTEKFTTSHRDRTEAELGINIKERERRDREVIEFNEIATNEQLQEKDMKGSKLAAIESKIIAADAPGVEEGRKSKHEHDSDGSSEEPRWSWRSWPQRRQEDERRRSRERRDILRDYELERTRKEIFELKEKQQLQKLKDRESEMLEEKKKYEIQLAKQDLEAIKRSTELAQLEIEIKQKMDRERLYKEEEVLVANARQEMLAKKAIDNYKEQFAEREAIERRLREEQEVALKKQLQEVNLEIRELKSRTEQQERKSWTRVAEPPMMPERMQGIPIWRIKRHHPPPHIVQIDHPSSPEPQQTDDEGHCSSDDHSSSNQDRSHSSSSEHDKRSLTASIEELYDDHEQVHDSRPDFQVVNDRDIFEGKADKGTKRHEPRWSHFHTKTSGHRRPGSQPQVPSAPATLTHEGGYNSYDKDNFKSPTMTGKDERLVYNEDSASVDNNEGYKPSSSKAMAARAESFDDLTICKDEGRSS